MMEMELVSIEYALNWAKIKRAIYDGLRRQLYSTLLIGLHFCWSKCFFLMQFKIRKKSRRPILTTPQPI
jgi:hypothetical protein